MLRTHLGNPENRRLAGLVRECPGLEEDISCAVCLLADVCHETGACALLILRLIEVIDMHEQGWAKAHGTHPRPWALQASWQP